jgi:lipid-A-disaccharide synthase
MRIFISAGEPSGDLHGSNLVRALRRLNPHVECVGFGGEHMAFAGCRLLYPLSRLAIFGVLRVLTNANTFLELLLKADRFFQRRRPDAVVLIDYPGFNWWVARRAHFHGIPVFYFVPPQLWAWAGWRVKKMRRLVDHVLCSLPFEEEWYQIRGVPARYIGHPYFDELVQQPADLDFVKDQQSRHETLIGLLPGSRSQEVRWNLSTLARTAAQIHARRQDAHFLVACYKESHKASVEDYLRNRSLPFIEPFVGRTPEILRAAHACVAVSGSVGLELLFHRKPSVIVYRVRSYHMWLLPWLKKSPYISLVNLLAQKELFPEFLTDRCQSEVMAGHIVRWLNDRAAYEATCEELTQLRQRVAKSGACERAAGYLLEVLEKSASRQAA